MYSLQVDLANVACFIAGATPLEVHADARSD